MVRLSSVAVAVTALVKTSSVLVTTTASLFLFVQSTTGLSTSFVYNDPLAQPHYHVQNHEDTIPASKVRSLEGVMTMTQPGGQRWACFMPPPAEMPSHTPSKTSQELEEEDSATIQRGLALLESLAGRCLQGTFEWWTYDFCYKKHIRQYRAVSVGDLLFPESEDWVFILSRYIPLSADNKQSDRHMVTLDESPSRHQAFHPTSFNKDTAWTTELDFYQDRNILIQRWEQGDICPYTNLPRQVKVQYQCAHTGLNFIHSTMEPTTCTYIMTINVPLLCTDPAFAIALPPKVNHIECRRIVSDGEQLHKAGPSSYTHSVMSDRLGSNAVNEAQDAVRIKTALDAMTDARHALSCGDTIRGLCE